MVADYYENAMKGPLTSLVSSPLNSRISYAIVYSTSPLRDLNPTHQDSTHTWTQLLMCSWKPSFFLFHVTATISFKKLRPKIFQSFLPPFFLSQLISRTSKSLLGCTFKMHS